MTLSRCGRVYPTFDAALKAAELRSSKSDVLWQATSCAFDDHWHVVEKSAKAVRLDPFPPVVAAQLDKRDRQCQRCGRSGLRLERHHRRAKSMGGSKARSHTQCACNGLRLCRTCHAYVHEHPAESRQNGWIVRQGVALPGRIAVNCCLGELVFDDYWPTCDGQWVHSPLETEM